MNIPKLRPVHRELIDEGSASAKNLPGLSKSSFRSACGTSPPHESAMAQVAGAATYVDDIPEVRGTLHAAPILSTVAHGKLRGVDASAALAMSGVCALARVYHKPVIALAGRVALSEKQGKALSLASACT